MAVALDAYTRTITSFADARGLRFIHHCDRCQRTTAITRYDLTKCFHRCGAIERPALPPRRYELSGRPGRERPIPAHLVECVHRGERLREVQCMLCGERDTMVAVFACSVHGECTLRHSGRPRQKLANCLGCDDRAELTQPAAPAV